MPLHFHPISSIVGHKSWVSRLVTPSGESTNKFIHTDLRKDIGHSSDQEKWYSTHTYKHEGLWQQSTENAKYRNMWTSLISGNICVGPRTFKIKEESCWFITTMSCRPWSICFAQYLPSTFSMSTERSRIVVKNWLSMFQIIDHPVQGILCLRLMNCWIAHSHQKSCGWTNEICCEVASIDSIKLPEDSGKIQASETLGSEENFSWTMFRDNPWSGRWMWWRCWIMPKIHVTSKWRRFRPDGMNSRRHENWSSTESQDHDRVKLGVKVRLWSL